MKGKSSYYEELLTFCQAVLIVDCHDHSTQLGPRYTDPIQVVIGEYLLSDLASVTSEAEAQTLLNSEIPWEDRWPLLEKTWKWSCHTGYAQITRRLLKKFYGEADVTLAALQRMQGRLLDLEDEAV